MVRAEASDYSLLASAVAGRRIAVHFSGGSEALAHSDGQAIILPSRERFGDIDECWVMVIAQACLIAINALHPASMRSLIGRREAARRYAYFEVLRATKELNCRLPNSFLALPDIAGAHRLAENRAQSLNWALSGKSTVVVPLYIGTVRPMSALSRLVGDEGFSAATASQAEGNFESKDVQEFDDDDETEQSKILKLFQNPFSGSSPLADMLNNILGAGVGKGGQEQSAEGGGAEIPVGRIERAMRKGVHAVMAKLPFDLAEVDISVEGGALRYPEWDHYKQIYRQDWAVVEEVEAWRPDGARPSSEFVLTPSRELQRQLASLGLDHEMHRRQRDGADLDEGRLLDCAISLASGFSPPNLDIYRASRRTRRDLAVAIALDISGSTAETDQSGRSVFDRQLGVAYQLGRSFSALGDTVALFGFHSWGRNLVRSVRLKGGEERWSARVAERFSMLEPYGYTRTGTAIRHGTRMLRDDMRLPNRLFILITDGIAYDQDYEAAYAEADASKALREAADDGVACVCLCIGGSSEREKLQAVFGHANLLMVDEPEKITPRIREICARALGRVSGGKRVRSKK
jgi:nitric oxide reductase NorD protein